MYYNLYEVNFMAKKKTKELWKKILVWAMLIIMVGSLFTSVIYAILA